MSIYPDWLMCAGGSGPSETKYIDGLDFSIVSDDLTCNVASGDIVLHIEEPDLVMEIKQCL